MDLPEGTTRISKISINDDVRGLVRDVMVGKNSQMVAAGSFDIRLLPLLETFEPDLVPLGLQVKIALDGRAINFLSDDDVLTRDGVTVAFKEARNYSNMRLLVPFDGDEITPYGRGTWSCRTQVAGKLISLFTLKENDVEVTIGDGGHRLTALGKGEMIPRRRAPKYDVPEKIKIVVENKSPDRTISPTSIVGVLESVR